MKIDIMTIDVFLLESVNKLYLLALYKRLLTNIGNITALRNLHDYIHLPLRILKFTYAQYFDFAYTKNVTHSIYL